MQDSSSRPFSPAWTIVSVVLFMFFELVLGTWVGPHVIGRYVSPMLHPQLQMALHLVSFYLGGWAVGLVSPGRRLLEPAFGAFVSVLLVFSMALFMPHWFLVFDLMKIALAGGIGFFVALLGAWHGEKLMGNIEPNDADAQHSARGRLRASLWSDERGLLVARRSRGRDRS